MKSEKGVAFMLYDGVSYETVPEFESGSCIDCAFFKSDELCNYSAKVIDCLEENLIWQKVQEPK